MSSRPTSTAAARVGRRPLAPAESRGDQLGGGRIRAGQVVLGREAVGAYPAGLGREQEPDREEHDLGQPSRPAGDQQRRRADLVQGIVVAQAAPSPAGGAVLQVARTAEVAERELGATSSCRPGA